MNSAYNLLPIASRLVGIFVGLDWERPIAQPTPRHPTRARMLHRRRVGTLLDLASLCPLRRAPLLTARDRSATAVPGFTLPIRPTDTQQASDALQDPRGHMRASVAQCRTPRFEPDGYYLINHARLITAISTNGG